MYHYAHIISHSRLTTTGIIPSPISLAMTKLGTLGGGLALARQVKVMLSAVLRGSKVRKVENDGLKPVTEEMVTLASLLDRRVVPLSQVLPISDMAISVSVAVLMEMVHVRVRGAKRPAKRGPNNICESELIDLVDITHCAYLCNSDTDERQV